MAKQTFTSGQVLTAAEMNSLQENDYNWTVTTKTASYTLAAGDEGTRVVMNNAGATTITVDDAVFAAGDVVWLHNIGAGTCTVTAGTATVNTAASLDLAQWEGGSLFFTSASSAIFFRGAVGVDGVAVEFLVVGGGGGGGSGPSGGGGGGSHFGGDGYDIFLPTSTNFEVVVGAGGAVNSNGSQSFFYNLTAEGGGAAGSGTGKNGGNGGGAGGSGASLIGGVSTTPVGFDGGDNFPQPGVGPTGGGGGAGGDGDDGASNVAGDGGIGASSSITGSAVLRAGGGGGGILTGTVGSGNDGGGNGAIGTGTAGTANTGGGGGGGGTTGAAGGSGVVILRYPNTYTITLGAGLTGSTATDGDDKVTTITAGSDTVSWS